ncbi:oligoendopeptidase F [Haloarchaeobius sp. DT45]|uniref:oligoendopeptidase F n=1 Tax=Haloarchaeobius sp. DT45 TaxID=3446116 RepID=UPI003F6AB560
MSSVPERSEIDTEYTWDLESIYATDEEWEEAFETVQAELDELEQYEGRVTEDGETLLSVLQLRDDIMREVSMVYSYARMRKDEDTTNQQYQAFTARAQSLSADASSAASFIDPEIQSATRNDIDAMVADVEDLETYEHYLDDVLRMKPHTRSAEVEELLADLSEVTGGTSEVYNMLANADMEFPTVEKPDGSSVQITQNNFTTLLKNQDREFRKTVHESFYEDWADVRNTVAAAYKNSVKADVKTAQARYYDTAREAALDGPNVPVDVYDNLLEAVRENLDKLHRHAELKADALGVDQLEMWDLYMPMTETESPDIEYEQACEWVVESLGALGEEYQERVQEGLDSRWVDVYENKGKQSGAYSGGTYDTQPFILMNWQDDISSMFTLAHELGHSMHSQYTKQEQPYVYSGYEIFVAEVASTVNEALLTQYLLDTVEDETFRRHVLNEYLERFRSTLYRQTMFADFEHQTHELVEDGEALTPDAIDQVYGDLKREFYEPANVDEHITREWMRIPHFYYSFYVYQYATGISAAVALSQKILDPDDETAADDYLAFLSKGSRKYPLELLRGAGVDMGTKKPVQEALDVYGEYLDEMADLI